MFFLKSLILVALATIAWGQNEPINPISLISDHRPPCDFNMDPMRDVPKVFTPAVTAQIEAFLKECHTGVIYSCDDFDCAYTCLGKKLHLVNDCGALVIDYCEDFVYHYLNDNKALDTYEANTKKCFDFAVDASKRDLPDSCSSQVYNFFNCIINVYRPNPYTNIGVDHEAIAETHIDAVISGPGQFELDHNEDTEGSVAINKGPDGIDVDVKDKAHLDTDLKGVGDGPGAIGVGLGNLALADSSVVVDTNENVPVNVNAENDALIKSKIELDSQGPAVVDSANQAVAFDNVDVKSEGPVDVDSENDSRIKSGVLVDGSGPVDVSGLDSAGASSNVVVDTNGPADVKTDENAEIKNQVIIDSDGPINVQRVDTGVAGADIKVNADGPASIDNQGNVNIESDIKVEGGDDPVEIYNVEIAQGGPSISVAATGPVDIKSDDNLHIDSNVAVDSSGPVQIRDVKIAGIDSAISVDSKSSDGKVKIQMGSGTSIKSSSG